MQNVDLFRRGAVAVVTLNRPEKRNALSIEMRFELADVFARLADDESCSVAVVTGAPPAFCSGMDYTQFGGDEQNKRALVDSTERFFRAASRFPLPLIAAVNGPAIGGGCALAAACDLRIASPTATFGHPEVDRGVPAPVGALLAMMPDQAAREMAYTGRIVAAEEALELGIVRALADDPLEAALELAQRIAKTPRLSLLRSKGLVLTAGETGPAARAAEAELKMFRDAML